LGCHALEQGLAPSRCIDTVARKPSDHILDTVIGRRRIMILVDLRDDGFLAEAQEGQGIVPVERARRTYEKEIASLRAATAGPSGLDLSDVRLTEIRTKLSATPQADRFAKIAKSTERGNDEVAAAVLNANRFFSDFLSDVEVSALQALWAKTRMPESVVRLSQLESDLPHIERTSRILTSYQRECAGPPIVPPSASGSTVVIHGSRPPPRNRAFG
jgi:hypothetical protein